MVRRRSTVAPVPISGTPAATRDKQKMHIRRAACRKFGAEAEIRPGLVGLNPDRFGWPGTVVFSASPTRTRAGLSGVQSECQRFTHWNVNLIGNDGAGVSRNALPTTIGDYDQDVGLCGGGRSEVPIVRAESTNNMVTIASRYRRPDNLNRFIPLALLGVAFAFANREAQ